MFQVREEVARLVVSAITSCDGDDLLQQERDGLITAGRVSSETAAAAAAGAAGCSCGCKPTEAAQRLRVYLQQQAAAVLPPLAGGESLTAAGASPPFLSLYLSLLHSLSVCLFQPLHRLCPLLPLFPVQVSTCLGFRV